MRTGKELIVATKSFAVDDPSKSWRYFLITLVLLTLALAGTVWNFHFAGKVVCSVLAGLLLVRTFVIYHDFQHNSILQNSRLADALMTVSGLFCLAAPSVWKSSHDYHHRHNSKLRSAQIGSYPIMTRENYEQASRKERLGYLLARHPLTIFFGYFSIFLLGMCVLPFFRSPKRHLDCLAAFVLHIGFGVAMFLFAGWQGLILTVMLPHFIAAMLGSYLFYVQHNFPAVVHHEKDGWTYHGAALESSSYLSTGPLMRFFTANIGYHHVHHLNARIPFYRLPEAMRKMPELQTPRSTSLNPLEVMRCLRLKLWDTDLGKMVRLHESTATTSEAPAPSEKPMANRES